MAPPIDTNKRLRLEAQLRQDTFWSFAQVFVCGWLFGTAVAVFAAVLLAH